MAERDVIFGRLFAIANILGDRVFEKGKPSIQSRFLQKYSIKPVKFLGVIHQELMQYANKFGEYEMNLFDMFTEIMAGLDLSDFTDDPLDSKYLHSFHVQQHAVRDVVGLKEAADILEWDRRKVSTYVGRGAFPEPIKRLSSGPLWMRQQIEEFKASRFSNEEPTHTKENPPSS